MATRTWLDVDGNWTNTANWSGATVPVTGDTIIIDAGNKDIVTNVDQNAVKDVLVKVGPRFTGTIGTAASPLKFGTLAGTGTLDHNAPLCQSANFAYTAGANVSRIRVYATAPIPKAFYLVSAPNISDFHAVSGQIQIGAAVVVADFYAYGRASNKASVTIESGVSINHLRVFGAAIKSFAHLATVYLYDGTIDQSGDSTGNVTVVLQQYGGVFIWRSPGSTVTSALIYGGLFDGSRDASTKTLSGGSVYLGGYMNLENGCGTIAQSSPVRVYGGNYRGLISPEIVIPPQ